MIDRCTPLVAGEKQGLDDCWQQNKGHLEELSLRVHCTQREK